MSHTTKMAGSLLDKASGTMGEIGTDEVMASAIVRAVKKQERVNKMLIERCCDRRISGFEIDNHVPPRVVYYVTEESK